MRVYIYKIFLTQFGQEGGCVDELSDTINNSTGSLMGINATSTAPIKCDDCFLLTTVETSTTQQVRTHGQS